jgi:predicted neutral ceramidase superfamily lipid hydrolase
MQPNQKYSLDLSKSQQRNYVFFFIFGIFGIALGIGHLFLGGQLMTIGFVWIALGLSSLVDILLASTIKKITVMDNDTLIIISWFGDNTVIHMSNIILISAGRNMVIDTFERKFRSHSNMNGLCRLASEIRKVNPSVTLSGL